MNVGIIGLGFMGATHAVTYMRMSNVRIAAVCARDEEKLAGHFSKQSGNLGMSLPDVDLTSAAKYRDWKRLTDDPNIDAVDICCPSDLHEEIAIAALREGKHVLCEKPMALSLDACDAMLLAAGESQRTLMIAHVLRFWPAYEYLRDWVRANSTGLRAARFERKCGTPDWSGWQTDPRRSGGALLDLLIHDLDQILLLFGMPRKVSARPVDKYDAIDATLAYPDGFTVQLRGGWLESGTPFSMGFEVAASESTLRFKENELRLAGSERSIALPNADAFEKELSYFIECCTTGQPPDLCPPQESRAAVKLALLLEQSRNLGGTEIACEL